MTSKLDQVDDLMKKAAEGETPTVITIHATITIDNVKGERTEVITKRVQGLLSTQPVTAFSVSAQRPATFDEKLAYLATGGRDSCNGHLLSPVRSVITEPCWKIAYYEGLREQARDQQALDDWERVRNSDFPNGLTHDETCSTCKGTDLQRKEITIAYACNACEMRHEERSGFFTTSCILDYGITKGIIEDWRDEHLDGEHSMYRKPGCPLCAAENMQRKAEKANA